jgi:tRNA A37 threonylcarbamoyladenosine modification protein TsaB
MRVLALETSVQTGSVALLEGDRLVGESQLDAQQRTAQSLTPAMARQLADAGWRPQDIQLVAVAITLEVIAVQSPPEVTEVCAVLNAQRQQLFAGTFRRGDPLWQTVRNTEIVDQEVWLRSLPRGLAVSGTGLAKLQTQLPPDVVLVDPCHWLPQAQTVGRLGYLAYQAGRRDDLWLLSPQYYRKSAAEEVWEAKQSAGP